MGLFSNLKEHIPIIKNIGKPKSNKSSVELQFDKAMNLMENANGTEAVEILEKITDIGIMDPQYKDLGTDALKILSGFYETGAFKNAKVERDLNKAAAYLEKYTNLTNDGESTYKTAEMYLEAQNFSKAISFFEKSTQRGIKSAYLKLGSIYENGLSRIDQYGNKSEFVIPVDLEKAMAWYKQLADMGDSKAVAAYERCDYASKHTDSLEFEEKDKLYSEMMSCIFYRAKLMIVHNISCNTDIEQLSYSGMENTLRYHP